jgi:menaquinol-cytochrome c reductase iron-sulfur subunit
MQISEGGQRLDRRTFQIAVIYGLWVLMTAALALPAAIYLLFPPRASRKSEWIDAGDVSYLKPNEPEEVVFRQTRVDGWKVTSEKATAWVVRTPTDEFIAFAPQCTHLGCAYHWDERNKYFLCPCHTSTFALDGTVLSGPAPRPLDRYRVKLENGHLFIGPLA